MTNARSRPLRFVAAAALALALGLTVAPAARAQTADKPTLTEEIGAQLAPLRPLIDAKDFAGGIALIERVLPSAKPASYDELVLQQIRAQLLLARGDYAAATPALERVLALDTAAPAPGFLDLPQRREILYYLSQLLFQEASAQKTPAAQAPFFARALDHARRWHATLERPTPEQESFLASLLYSIATADPAAIDRARLAEARAVAERALTAAPRAPETARLILVGAAQAQDDFAAAIDQLELVVEASPTNAGYWSQLAGLYLSQAGALETRDPRAARAANLRAILTLERAQAKGLLNGPRDQLNLIGLYFNHGHFGEAARLLRAGLAAGAVESTRRNWELLASALQQSDQAEAALAALKDAATRLPAEPQLLVQASQILYGREQVAAAYDLALAATRSHGQLDTPGAARVYAAYLAFELRRYDEARELLAAAETHADAKAAEIQRLRAALDDAAPLPKT